MPRKPTDPEPEAESRPDPATPPLRPPRSETASPAESSSAGLRSQLESIPRLIQTNMALLEQKYSSLVELQTQQFEQAKQVVAQLNALFQVAEEFLSNVDEVTDKLIEETAAIVQLRSDLAAEALASTQTNGASGPSGTTPTRG